MTNYCVDATQMLHLRKGLVDMVSEAGYLLPHAKKSLKISRKVDMSSLGKGDLKKMTTWWLPWILVCER